MKETNILRRIQIALTEIGVRVFRNQVGRYQLIDGRYLQSGLVKGASDLVGWTSVTITPEMIGRRVAVFTGIEVKGPKGQVTAEQHVFLENVRQAGGIAVVARSEEEAVVKVREYRP